MEVALGMAASAVLPGIEPADREGLEGAIAVCPRKLWVVVGVNDESVGIVSDFSKFMSASMPASTMECTSSAWSLM